MLTLLLIASALRVSSTELDLKERPVTKVVKLLEKMQQELEKEKADDQELFDKMACWCENVGNDKELAITTANKRIAGYSADAQAMAAKSTELDAQITQLKQEIADNDQALRKADAMRQADLAEFTKSEKELLASINALGDAIVVLQKHQSFLQVSSSSLVDVAATLQHLRAKATKVLAPPQVRTLDAFLAQPAGYQSHASQSGTIFGVLQQMKESFETDLSDSQSNEQQSVSDFQALKKAKTAEMDAAKAQVADKSEDLATTNENLAQTNADLQLTTEALAADTAFLRDLRDRCSRSDADFTERSKTRQEEIVAVGQTIQILTSDESFDLFGKSLSLLQLTSHRIAKSSQNARLSKAARVLRAAAAKSGAASMRALAVLAESAGLAAFEKVKKAIDDMVTELNVQQKDQVTHRDFCIKELDETTTNRATKQDDIDDLSAHIETSKARLDDLTKALAELAAQTADMKTSMKRASEDREAENAEFQTQIAEQRGTQFILNKALDRMKAFYEGKAPELTDQLGNAVAAVQTGSEPGAAAPPPPAGFNDYKKNEGGGGVLGMLQELIGDSKAMENDALKAENDSQSAYENFVKDNNKSVKMNNEMTTQKVGEKADTEQDLTQAESDRKHALGAMEKLMAYDATLHSSCDFTLKNFDAIQAARADEVEALRQAKAILSGADFA